MAWDLPISDHEDVNIARATIVDYCKILYDVKWSQLIRSSQFTINNAGVVTISTSEATIVTGLALDAVINDVVQIQSLITGTKGNVAGDTDWVVRQTGGTGIIVLGNNADTRFQSATKTYRFSGNMNGLITQTGTIILSLRAYSSGSNLTINNKAAMFWVTVFKN